MTAAGKDGHRRNSSSVGWLPRRTATAKGCCSEGLQLGRTPAGRTAAAKAAFEDIPMVTDCIV